MEERRREEGGGEKRREKEGEKEVATMDEFEKRMYFSSFITTLADVATKMNPITLVGTEGEKAITEAGLKDQYQSAIKRWLDLMITYTQKAQKLGEKYPIEKILGIEES